MVQRYYGGGKHLGTGRDSSSWLSSHDAANNPRVNQPSRTRSTPNQVTEADFQISIPTTTRRDVYEYDFGSAAAGRWCGIRLESVHDDEFGQ